MQKRQASLETERLIRKKIHIIPNTIHHSTHTFSEIQFMLKRPNSLPLQTEAKISVIPCACLWCAGNPSLWKPWPKSLAPQDVSWPHLIASGSTCKSLVASQLGRHIYFKFSAYCASTGTFTLYYQHILRSSCKVKQQMTTLLKQLSPRHAKRPGMTSMAGLKKEKKKGLVPAAIMIYGSFKRVSKGVPFWLCKTKAWD